MLCLYSGARFRILGSKHIGPRHRRVSSAKMLGVRIPRIAWRWLLEVSSVFGCPPDAQFRGMLPVPVLDTQAIQLTQDFCDRLIQRCFYRLAQAAARLVRLSFNS